MRIKSLRSILVGVFFSIVALCCNSVRADAITESESPTFGFKLTDFVTHTDDHLLRVKGKLIGIPHTSNRIDEAQLITGRDTIVATDIDGVDFNRWFQWEDSNFIAIELDFVGKNGEPVPSLNRTSQFRFVTARGTFICPVQRKTKFRQHK